MEQTVENLTIGAFAEAAGVNVETIRFYQRKGLLSEPAARLVGPEIIDFLHGRLALSMDGAKIKITRVED